MKKVHSRPETELRDTDSRAARKPNGFLRSAGILLLLVSIAFMSSSYVTTRYITLMHVNSDGMENVLQAGDVVGCSKNIRVERGDIIAFSKADATMIKRVIATAGDEINITKDGTVYLNGNALSEPYTLGNKTDAGDVTYPLTVPEGEVFVTGDNRVISIDSRNAAVGNIPLEDVIGVVEMRLWPVYRFGRL